uniref:uncharacterized protein LOC117723706 n=1 Tax=Arvicanthis niloticus TaxID=61156 RepID=UPI0014873374|nr:uncharacterized protein LOC117723706 [Arvicanthis niloticus]
MKRRKQMQLIAFRQNRAAARVQVRHPEGARGWKNTAGTCTFEDQGQELSLCALLKQRHLLGAVQPNAQALWGTFLRDHTRGSSLQGCKRAHPRTLCASGLCWQAPLCNPLCVCGALLWQPGTLQSWTSLKPCSWKYPDLWTFLPASPGVTGDTTPSLKTLFYKPPTSFTIPHPAILPCGKIQESCLKGDSTSVKNWQLQERAWSSDTDLPPIASGRSCLETRYGKHTRRREELGARGQLGSGSSRGPSHQSLKPLRHSQVRLSVVKWRSENLIRES